MFGSWSWCLIWNWCINCACQLAPYSPLRSSKIRSYIQGTSLRGREVHRFWSHQDCFRLDCLQLPDCSWMFSHAKNLQTLWKFDDQSMECWLELRMQLNWLYNFNINPNFEDWNQLVLFVGSQTGRWVLDETPRAMCCKVKVYHTANFTRCDYALRYCNTTSGTVVYGSPLPASLADQIRSWTVSNLNATAYIPTIYQL